MDTKSALLTLRLAPPLVLDESDLERWKTETLKPTYRAWQKVVHPDVNGHDDANDLSTQVNAAYNLLWNATFEQMMARPRQNQVSRPHGVDGPEVHTVRLSSNQRKARVVLKVPLTRVVIGVYW